MNQIKKSWRGTFLCFHIFLQVPYKVLYLHYLRRLGLKGFAEVISQILLLFDSLGCILMSCKRPELLHWTGIKQETAIFTVIHVIVGNKMKYFLFRGVPHSCTWLKWILFIIALHQSAKTEMTSGSSYFSIFFFLWAPNRLRSSVKRLKLYIYFGRRKVFSKEYPWLYY